MSMRTALITGASRGIGKACAHALASSGHRVVLAARSTEKLAEVAREIGSETFVLEMDLASRDSITTGMTRAAKDFGRIDVHDVRDSFIDLYPESLNIWSRESLVARSAKYRG